MITKVYAEFLKSSGVTTDSRNVAPNSLFIGLNGPNFNGSSYARQALEKGARMAIVDDPAYGDGDNLILVEDSLEMLQKLGRHHRDQFDIPVIGLTGSNGKTTTKELIHAVLSQRYNSLATSGNYNNHIGVPLTLLELKPDHEIAIIEMGANHVGEIAELCRLANPSHGLITNIGKAHIEGFGGFEGVIRGKTELYQHLRESEGTVFINSGNEILSNMAKRFPSPVMYPGKGDFYSCELLGSEPFLRIQTEDGELRTQLIGEYNFDNVATALCLGKFFEVDPAQANQAVARYVPADMRSQVITSGSTTIIMDAYNANPSSMDAAVDNLVAMDVPKKAVILGDMFELGESAEEEHRALGKRLSAANLDRTFLCGPLMRFAAEECPSAEYFEGREELAAALGTADFADYTVLVKGSRGMRLEEAASVISKAVKQ